MRSMSQRTECLLVLLVAFAMPVLSSVMALIAPSTQPAITEDGLRSLIVYEGVVLLALVPVLRLRGWERAHLGIVWSRWDLPAGALLTLATLLVCSALAVLLQDVAHIVPPPRDALVARDIPLATVALASMVNPLFEELFLCGYLVGVLKSARGTAFAVNASTALRLSYHLYQGTPSVLIIPVGLLFAAWYARTGRLWPVVIAHATFDALALATP